MGKLLDLILSNNNTIQIIKSSSVTVPCDPFHPPLVLVISLVNEVPTIDVSHNYYNFHKAKYPEILKFLETFNLIETIKLLDVDSAANFLYDILHFCILHFVLVSRYVKFKFPTWFTKKLKTIFLAKRRAYALFKSSNNPHHYAQFSNLRV